MEEQQLHDKRAGDAQLLQRRAQPVHAGAGDQGQGGADGEDEAEQNREERDPASGNDERPEAGNRHPIHERIEHADGQRERRRHEDFLQDKPCRDAAQRKEGHRIEEKGGQRGDGIAGERHDNHDKRQGDDCLGPRVEPMRGRVHAPQFVHAPDFNPIRDSHGVCGALCVP